LPRRFPFEPARDLLGILRALYAYEKSRPFPQTVKMRQIAKLATELSNAMNSAEWHDPGTAPYERALSRAEGVALRVADVVTVVDSLEPVLMAASDRVRGRASKATEREQRWAVGKKRN
jgi:hypothetical protein